MSQLLDIGAEKAHLSGREFLHVHRVRRKRAQTHHFVFPARSHEPDAVAQAQNAVHDAEQNHHSLIGIVPGVKDKRLERGLKIALRGGEAVDHCVQHLVDIQPRLGRDCHGIGAVQPDTFLYFGSDAVGVGAGQIDLVQYRHDLMVMIQREIDVGQGLRFHALCGVHHQQRAVAGREGAGNLIVEVHMAGGINEIQNILRAVPVPVRDADGLRLDGNAALAFQIHLVQILIAFFAVAHEAGIFEDAVGQGGFAVVNVGDDAEVAEMFQCGHGLLRCCFCRNREWRVCVPAS